MARLNAADLVAADLSRMLATLHSGFDRIEPLLAAEVWYRPQAPALAADLARLPAVERRLTPPPGPALPDVAARLGAAYVLIGSRLGAKSIAKRLRPVFGEDFVRDSAYYGAEAEHASGQWQALMQRLDAVGETPEQTASATQAAAAVFALLIALSEQASAGLVSGPALPA